MVEFKPGSIAPGFPVFFMVIYIVLHTWGSDTLQLSGREVNPVDSALDIAKGHHRLTLLDIGRL